VTVSANDRRKEYPGDGLATVFNGPMAYSATHITAALVEDATGVVSSAGSFTVSQLGKPAGTRVTLTTAPPAGFTLVLLRTLPISQIVDITNQGAFNANVLEQGLDLLDMQIQQINDDQQRSLRLSDYTLGVSTLLDPSSGDLIGWAGDGSGVVNYTIGAIAAAIGIPGAVYVPQSITAAGGQTVFDLVLPYAKGIGALSVYCDGLKLRGGGVDYTETSATRVTLTSAALEGQQFEFVHGQNVSTSQVDVAGITYQAPGSLFVRTQYGKNSDVVSVKDFGALGDGVTDDSAAVVAADAALVAQGGGTLLFPGGPYALSGQPDAGVTWRFEGAPVQRTLLGGGANFEAANASYTYLAGPHTTIQKTAEYTRVLAQGSENIGQSFCDAAYNIHIQKEHWSETTGTPKAGEIDGLCITYRQGGPRVGGGDPLAGISSGAAILLNAQATQACGATQLLEAVNSVVTVPGLAVNRQIGVQMGMLNTRDGDYYGHVLISTTGTQSAAYYAISEPGSTWTNVLMSRVGSYVPYFISVLGRSRWQTVAGVNASLEQEDPSGDLVFKNTSGTEIFRVGQTRTTAAPNTARVASTTSESISQADHQRIVVLANAAAITCTLSATAAVGTTVRAIQRDAGQVTFTPAGGATLNNRSSHTKTAGQYAAVTLEVRANGGGSAAIWVLSGDTAA